MARPKAPSVYPAPGQTHAELQLEWEKYNKWNTPRDGGLSLFELLSPQDLHRFVGQVLKDNGFCGISATRDGGCVSFYVTIADNKFKLAVTSADQFEAEVEMLTRPAPKRP